VINRDFTHHQFAGLRDLRFQYNLASIESGPGIVLASPTETLSVRGGTPSRLDAATMVAKDSNFRRT
jgi:hypothetical protein